MTTLADAFDRYSRTVSEKKKGRRWEQIRLKKLAGDPLADVRFADLAAGHIADFRDRRLVDVAASSVAREMTLISSVIQTARREWGWIDHNPCSDVKRPEQPPHRDRRITDDEIDRLCFALGYGGGQPVDKSQQVAVMFLLAIETAMRQGEIVGIRRADVDLVERWVRLSDTKNGSRRYVPLSKEAVRLLSLMDGDDCLFSVTAAVASTLFRRARKRAEIDDLTFHDSRHEACTRLAQKIEVLDLARMTGHKDLKQLLAYYNAKPSEIAARLDSS